MKYTIQQSCRFNILFSDHVADSLVQTERMLSTKATNYVGIAGCLRTHLVPSAGTSINSLQGSNAARQHNGPRQNKDNIAAALILLASTRKQLRSNWVLDGARASCIKAFVQRCGLNFTVRPLFPDPYTLTSNPRVIML